MDSNFHTIKNKKNYLNEASKKTSKFKRIILNNDDDDESDAENIPAATTSKKPTSAPKATEKEPKTSKDMSKKDGSKVRKSLLRGPKCKRRDLSALEEMDDFRNDETPYNSDYSTGTDVSTDSKVQFRARHISSSIFFFFSIEKHVKKSGRIR